MKLEVINPATLEKGKTYDSHTKAEVEKKVAEADLQQKSWRKTHVDFRKTLMLKAHAELITNKEEYAQIMTTEMGKTIASSRAEVEKCAWVCKYYANHARDFLSDELVETDASKSYITYQPLGVVLAVMPWNYPFWQVFRFAAPALMAGNAALLKHASNVPGSALAIERVFEKAGFPKGLFSTLLVSSDEVEGLLEDKRIKAATLTGSGPAGSAVASTAGSHIKKTVLELGGSDPYLILKDADLELAAETCKAGRLTNTGQSCIGAKRFIIVKAVYDDFLKLFKEKMEAAKIGDPMDLSTDMGPMAKIDLRDELHEQVEKSIEAGAECILGGKISDRKGAFYPPTILINVKPGMPAYDEELFGPVASVIKVEDEEEAIRVANDTEFGLGSAVFTTDIERGEYIAKEELQAGSAFVNAQVKSDPRLPFGGINDSGYGRELSTFGIREFTNIKTIYIK